MDKSSGDQDTGTEVLAKEEHLGRNVHPLDLLRYDRKASSSDTGCKHDDCSCKSNVAFQDGVILTNSNNMERKVIHSIGGLTSTRRLLHHIHVGWY